MLAGSECFTFSPVMTRILAPPRPRMFSSTFAAAAAFALLEPVYGIREVLTREFGRVPVALLTSTWTDGNS